ncbi:uncharacterized protein LOC126285097 [Schistocerca gregaria]|uniref:uncharacterized protein LOC126285097 n=1 Tax=Schistocerca gregaria TaxID=7010 RepID=UPI00211DAE42|nr:uncharacterized protein LOC126285097 [Schistocerca gregaria]
MAEEISRSTMKLVNKNFLSSEEKLILPYKTDTEALFEARADDPSVEGYDSEDYEDSSMEYVPLDVKAEVVALAEWVSPLLYKVCATFRGHCRIVSLTGNHHGRPRAQDAGGAVGDSGGVLRVRVACHCWSPWCRQGVADPCRELRVRLRVGTLGLARLAWLWIWVSFLGLKTTPTHLKFVKMSTPALEFTERNLKAQTLYFKALNNKKLLQT